MTGDEAYHADCFRCIQCASKIDDLVFAKTSQGIYCMNCHQERKEAKRQREERERMDRAERMMEKLLPTIPEGEKRALPAEYNWTGPQPFLQQQASQQQPSPQQDQNQPYPTASNNPLLHDNTITDMPRLPFSKTSRPDYSGIQKTNKVSPLPRANLKGGQGLPVVDTGPPFLPPLIFGLDDASTSSFDLGDMLGDSDTVAKDATTNGSVSPGKDADVKALDVNSSHTSVGRTSTSSAAASDRSSPVDGVRTMSESPEPSGIARLKGTQSRLFESIPRSTIEQSEHDTSILAEAYSMIKELRMELAKYNPLSPLLHGTQQQEYGLLLEKTKRLTQEHTALEKSIRELHIEKDLLVMDLEAMQEELRTGADNAKDNPALTLAPNPRFSTSHDFMKQAYQTEVKALQDEKEKLQHDIQLYAAQRDGVLDEMQILSVRNAELSTINNDMMREMQGRSDGKLKATTPNNGMLQSFMATKIRRQRQHSGGNQNELKVGHVLGSSESTHSFSSSHSEDRGRYPDEHSLQKARKEDRSEDIFGEDVVTPKKFNWKKGTTNTVKSVGAMFGKLLVEGAPSSSLEVPHSRGGQLLSDSSSANGLVLGAKSLSSNSETRSLSERSMEQHNFFQHNYVRRTQCDGCDDKIWGREYKCRNCGFQVHGRCMHEIIPSCTGSYKDSDSASIRNLNEGGHGSSHGASQLPPNQQVMFGNDLLDQLEREQRTVPLVVEKCIEAVDERGLDVEGIYRRSGMAAEARQLVQAYDVGLQPDLNDTEVYQDICSITSVLKQYLRSLPEPLIPYGLYAEFMEAISLPQNDTKIQTFKDLMERMPFAYYQTLKVLLEHLNRVTQRDKVNLMNSKNLSVVFGPTLMRNPDPSKEIMDMTYKNMTVEFFITNTSELFVRNTRPSTSSSHGTSRPSTSSTHEQPSPSSITQHQQSQSQPGSPPPQFQSSTPQQQQQRHHQQEQQQQQLQQRQGPIGSSTPVAPPRRANNARPAAIGLASPSGNGSIPTTPLSKSPASTDPASTSSATSSPLQSHVSPVGPPQPVTYQPTTQFRPQPYQPQQHQTLQQLHQKQQQLQMKKVNQDSQAGSSLLQSAIPTPQQLQSPPSSQSSATSYPQSLHLTATPQQQQANPDVDMTHFP
ncbi:hypothetical protein BGZ83_009847 [Gryganskiella cystojenkinii]|nr:hypothetical protein BGZ83_009847 [Gryganskiella cystojenkinii]